MRFRFSILVMALVAMAFSAAEASASPWIHAHRGGPLENGKAAQAENSSSGFAASIERGFVLEADVKLTSDKVPVIIHDDTLDRTTTCTGPVSAKTLDEIESECALDVKGIGDAATNLRAGYPGPTPRIPTLAAFLQVLKRTGAKANIEIKNLPTDNDWDPTFEFAEIVANTVKNSGVPSSQLIIQSFLIDNLTTFKSIDPDPQTSYLTINLVNPIAISAARDNGIDWVSPEWPIDQAFVSDAHHAGLQVVPWTVDDAAGVREATRLGVDALITNDPLMARTQVRKVAPPLAAIPKAPNLKSCNATFARDTRRPALAMLGRKDARGGPACSRCSSSRKPGTSRPTRVSARRSNA